jgi:hypothetical protein
VRGVRRSPFEGPSSAESRGLGPRRTPPRSTPGGTVAARQAIR